MIGTLKRAISLLFVYPLFPAAHCEDAFSSVGGSKGTTNQKLAPPARHTEVVMQEHQPVLTH